MIVKKLYWQRYRPKNVDGMILLPRIANELLDKDGNIVLSGNYIFYGTSGNGKSSMAGIVCPDGALKINASYNSSVEDLKDVVVDYCRTADIFASSSLDGYKIVWLEEFDGVSAKYQEALRAFIEDYSDRIRFIATCNNISKISPAILSRFNAINFDPESLEEVSFLKQGYLERCQLIREKNSLNVNDTQLMSIINSTFPDLRSVLNTLQKIEKLGKFDKEVIKNANTDLYDIIFGKIAPNDTYAYVMENYGDKVEQLVRMCGRPLAEYIFEQKRELINAVPKILPKVRDYGNDLGTSIDPLVLAVSLIYEIQLIVNSK